MTRAALRYAASSCATWRWPWGPFASRRSGHCRVPEIATFAYEGPTDCDVFRSPFLVCRPFSVGFCNKFNWIGLGPYFVLRVIPTTSGYLLLNGR